MNCRRVEKLLPLFVEDDLRPALATSIASHLEWCGKCNWLADEYKESQGWLRASTTPEFDRALLDSVKNGALAQIAANRQRPLRWAAFAEHWNRRQVCALSAAALIIVGALVIYVYQTRVRDSRNIEAETKVATEVPQINREGNSRDSAEPAPEAGFPPRRFVKKRTGHSASGFARAGASAENHQLEVAQSLSRVQPAATGDNSSSDSKDMLRIEIQTSDPLIRIIWFAPRESDSPPTKPATD
ncbi:MAG TPA: zf-HC2 domain-containing protein [Blastocatellia bacterium]|nr:zf-HC2 domain-containing protein [Blastocatellia bacterium]